MRRTQSVALVGFRDCERAILLLLLPILFTHILISFIEALPLVVLGTEIWRKSDIGILNILKISAALKYPLSHRKTTPENPIKSDDTVRKTRRSIRRTFPIKESKTVRNFGFVS